MSRDARHAGPAAGDWLPDYLGQVPALQLLDPLGAFLTGNPDPRPVSYRFADAVKLSGHCCPTVAGAWTLLLTALPRLYPETTPVRGDIAIDAPGSAEEGALGPFTQVLSYVTGACADNGFHGLGGRFRRTGLLRFRGHGSLADPFVFSRRDSGAEVALRYDPSVLPDAPGLGELLALALRGDPTPEQLAALGRLWQGRVRALLLSPELRARAVVEA